MLGEVRSRWGENRATRITMECRPFKENLMRVALAVVVSAACLALGTMGLHAQDYLTKDGQLTHQLKVVQLQGGFAGNTGVQYTIAPDGTWTAESIFKQKATLKSKGKLTEKELAM